MIRATILTLAAFTALTVGLTPAVAATPPSPTPAAYASWSLGSGAPAVPGSAISGSRVVYSAPTWSAAAITATPSSIESYAYWAAGVRITGVGFTPGEPVVVADTAPSGLRLTFETVPVDASGRLDHVYKTEVNGAPVGRHQLRAVGARSGRTATTVVTVTANALQTLRVSTSPTSISQNQFIRTPVTLIASGLAPHERLFVNLFGPDGSGRGLASDQALYADATGGFRYALVASTVAVPTGEWQVSVVAQSGAYGSSLYQVTPGPPAEVQGTLTFSPQRLTASALTSSPLNWSMTGLGAFQAYDLTLGSPLGAVTAMGTVRADGSGTYSDALKSQGGAVQLGTYRITATSRTTGNTASGTFIVTDANGNYPPNASVRVTPGQVSAADAHTVGRGFAVSVAHASPGSFLTVSVTAPDMHFPALRDGKTLQGSSSLYSSIGNDGAATVQVVFVRPQPAGRYRIDVYFLGGHLSTWVTVTP